MIHYTLLPEKEIKSLKKEYRTRLFIVMLFFVSCAIFIGIISLVPSYIYSYTQEKDALKNLQALQDGRRERGTDVIMKDLSATQALIDSLKFRRDGIEFSQVIHEIILRKPAALSINSFQATKSPEAETASVDVVIQGKAPTRDSLLALKKSLEQNPLISKIDLPVSDLAKSKDISFVLRLTIKTP